MYDHNKFTICAQIHLTLTINNTTVQWETSVKYLHLYAVYFQFMKKNPQCLQL